MRFEKTVSEPDEHEINMTPMIDVIFQLVLFFVFSMKFLAFEGHINAFLPKNRGLDASQPDFSKELRQVTLFLTWDDADGGTASLSTLNYVPPGGGTPVDDYTFPLDPGVRRLVGPEGEPRAVTETTMVSPDGKEGGKVVYDYATPDFRPVEAYLADQKRQYQERGLGAGLRLTVNFESEVPWQMVVNIVDICTRVGITDFALNPLELEY
jgi:biopolymer transport protein ExbD